MKIIQIILLYTISLTLINCHNDNGITLESNGPHNTRRNLLFMHKRNYNIRDPVFLWANKVGPFTNPRYF